MRWGLIPPWAKDPSIGNRMINARSETLTSKPAFREAFRRRRCVVPMDGFYEWQARAVEGSARPLKIPFWIHRPDRAPFAVAGLWERWRPEKGADPWISFTLLTTAANEWMGPLHDRMPVVLDPEGVDRWLDPEVDPDSLQPLLRPAPDRTFEAWEVDREVNRPVNDHDGLIEPVPGGTVLPAVP
jgi:putative SOS response-associated peptidase YedK